MIRKKPGSILLGFEFARLKHRFVSWVCDFGRKQKRAFLANLLIVFAVDVPIVS
jgi:hypothetical protein